MRVLDLFAGLGGLSRGWRHLGHDVVALDLDPGFNCDLTLDATAFAEDPWRYLWGVRPDWHQVDVVVGGPPCEAFSVMRIGANWTGPPTHQPKTEAARLGVRLVEAFLATVETLGPSWWWMENPRAKLRALPIMKGHRRVTVTYCQYGTPYQKPTDLWGRWPPSWRPRPPCAPESGCHVSAPRGSRTGVQGGVVAVPGGPSAAALRAEVPLALSLEMARACEAPAPRRDSLDAWLGVPGGGVAGQLDEVLAGRLGALGAARQAE